MLSTSKPYILLHLPPRWLEHSDVGNQTLPGVCTSKTVAQHNDMHCHNNPHTTALPKLAGPDDTLCVSWAFNSTVRAPVAHGGPAKPPDFTHTDSCCAHNCICMLGLDIERHQQQQALSTCHSAWGRSCCVKCCTYLSAVRFNAVAPHGPAAESRQGRTQPAHCMHSRCCYLSWCYGRSAIQVDLPHLLVSAGRPCTAG